MAIVENFQKFNDGLNSNIPNQEVAASTSGSLFWNMPFQGATYKKVIIYVDDATGDADITFTTEFEHPPVTVFTSGNLGGLVSSLTTTGCSITGLISNSGFIIIEGF